MISADKAVLARLDTHGKKFEILVEPNLALEVKKGKEIPIDDLVASMEVFHDNKKGERVKETDLKNIFGTTDFKQIAYSIVKKGEVQLTADQRRKMKEAKELEVATMIARRAMDPQTKMPHNAQRIQNAMKDAKVHVDERESAQAQVEKIVAAIRTVLPISIEEMKIEVRIPALFAAKAYGKVKGFGRLHKDEWKDDGSWLGVLEIPAGMQGDFYTLVNNLTNGQASVEIMK